MNDNLESFDNICINSQDSDIDVEVRPSFPIRDSNKLTANQNEMSPELCYSNHKTVSKSELVENISIDESSNDSDEVKFIREISKPLLNKSGNKRTRIRKHLYLQNRKKWAKFIGLCFIVTISIAIVMSLLVIFLPNDIWRRLINRLWGRYLFSGDNTDDVIGCDVISVDDIWIHNFPQLLTEGSARLININDDNILDVVLPFGTNVQNKIVCKIYYPRQERCFGGLLALDGRTGESLWRYDGNGEMYALVCLDDLNKDGWTDCLGAGRQGTFAAVSGRDGKELWAFDKNAERNTFMNLYTAQFIDDVDGDGIRDIVQMHGGDPVAEPSEMNRLIAKIMIFSGRTGETLLSTIVPDNHESYYSPQLLNLGDGIKKIIIGTGGETFPGSLYEMNLFSLLNEKHKGELRSKQIYKGSRKGVMTPPVLVDLNLDGRPDIVICPFADECLALDGVTFKQIWKFNLVKDSETYVTPAAGFYNDDNVPDIFIQLFVGLGYPVYFYGETLILDGRDGTLLKNLTRSNNVVISSPLTLSIEGRGNDFFLYWLQLCRDHESEINNTPFQNLPQYMITRAHMCKIRFNTTTESLFLVHGRNIVNQSIKYGQIYNSENYFHIEHNYTYNITKQIEHFLSNNPKYRPLYARFLQKLETTNLAEADESYARNKDDYHDSILKDQMRLENIDLNDLNIHDSIDFSKPPEDNSDAMEAEQYIRDSLNRINNQKFRFRRSIDKSLLRFKRHNGPHDGEGLQRLVGTGTLAPPILDINHKDLNYSMDIIFFTYWSEPKEIVLQTRKEIKCNSKWANMEPQRFKNSSKFFRFDHDHYTKYGNLYCAKKYGRREPLSKKEKQSTVFNNHFGQLTAYRKRIKCTCSPGRLQASQRCSRILPIHLQTWPAYLGLGGTAYWNSSVSYFKFIK